MTPDSGEDASATRGITAAISEVEDQEVAPGVPEHNGGAQMTPTLECPHDLNGGENPGGHDDTHQCMGDENALSNQHDEMD